MLYIHQIQILDKGTEKEEKKAKFLPLLISNETLLQTLLQLESICTNSFYMLYFTQVVVYGGYAYIHTLIHSIITHTHNYSYVQ